MESLSKKLKVTACKHFSAKPPVRTLSQVNNDIREGRLDDYRNYRGTAKTEKPKKPS